MRILNSRAAEQDSIFQTGLWVSQSSRTFSMLDCSCSTRHYSTVSFCSCKLRWRIGEYVLLLCFNVQPDIFAVMNCCVVALSVFTSDILTLSVNSWYSVQWHTKGSGCRKIYILCQQTSPKGWFGNMNMTSNCDVTNSAHKTQMTPSCHWMKTTPWKFSAYATVTTVMLAWWKNVEIQDHST